MIFKTDHGPRYCDQGQYAGMYLIEGRMYLSQAEMGQMERNGIRAIPDKELEDLPPYGEPEPSRPVP